REWIYHTSEELYQVLYKGAVLQRQLPQARIVPVLVCRRAHITAFRMMKDLGGYIIDVRQQWLPPGHARATNEDLLEVRNELYFQDLNFAPANWIHPFLRRQLAVHLPRNIADQADRWLEAGHRHEAEYLALWQGESLANLARVRERVSGAAWYQGGW